MKRFPTAAAIASLAERFDLPTGPHMQDWEYEVADVARFDEFLDAYQSGELDDDERFTLMETLIQTGDNMLLTGVVHDRWPSVLQALRVNIGLHLSSVRYWARSDVEFADEPDHQFLVSSQMREILASYAVE